jgi:adenosine deaminase
MRDLIRLPKAHLHVHLEGAMRPSTLAEIAAGYGIPVPPIRGYGSFLAFSGLYQAAEAVLQTEEDVRRVVREVVEDAAADGAIHIEPQMYPGRYSASLGSSGDVLDLIVDEGQATASRLGISFGLILSADRVSDPADAEAMAQLAAERVGAGLVGFGLASDEANWPPEPFAKAFAIAREAGLMSVPHAGEHAGPASVLGALDALGADRIEHGVRAVEDPELVRRIAAEGVCLDVCPTSNVMLSVVPDLASHPLAQLIEAGVRCSLNGDDPLLFGPGLLDEYQLARDSLGLDDAAIGWLARCSIEDSGADPAVKATGVAGVEAWLADAG